MAEDQRAVVGRDRLVPGEAVTAVADDDISVVLSSHLVADLERICDYLIVVAGSRVQIAGDVEELLACHHRLTGVRRDPSSLPADQHIVEVSHTDRQSTFLVRSDGPVYDPAWTVEEIGLEDLVLAYMRRAGRAERSGSTARPGGAR